MSPGAVKRIFWWTRSRLLESGLSWAQVRALSPAETAQRWVEVRKGEADVRQVQRGGETGRITRDEARRAVRSVSRKEDA